MINKYSGCFLLLNLENTKGNSTIASRCTLWTYSNLGKAYF